MGSRLIGAVRIVCGTGPDMGRGKRGSVSEGAFIPVERERSQCKLIKVGGRAWGCFQAS